MEERAAALVRLRARRLNLERLVEQRAGAVDVTSGGGDKPTDAQCAGEGARSADRARDGLEFVDDGLGALEFVSDRVHLRKVVVRVDETRLSPGVGVQAVDYLLEEVCGDIEVAAG